MKRILLAAVLALGLSAPVHAQEALPYTEGAVVEVTAVDIMDGEFDNYLEYLQSKYKPIMEAIIKIGFKGHVAQEFIPARPDAIASLKQGVDICDV